MRCAYEPCGKRFSGFCTWAWFLSLGFSRLKAVVCVSCSLIILYIKEIVCVTRHSRTFTPPRKRLSSCPQLVLPLRTPSNPHFGVPPCITCFPWPLDPSGSGCTDHCAHTPRPTAPWLGRGEKFSLFQGPKRHFLIPFWQWGSQEELFETHILYTIQYTFRSQTPHENLRQNTPYRSKNTHADHRQPTLNIDSSSPLLNHVTGPNIIGRISPEEHIYSHTPALLQACSLSQHRYTIHTLAPCTPRSHTCQGATIAANLI